METVLAYLISALPESAVDSGYAGELAAAIAAAVALVIMLMVVYLVFRVTYLILKVFSEGALKITLIIFVAVILIGWLNR